jgi:hypothetical protein
MNQDGGIKPGEPVCKPLNLNNLEQGKPVKNRRSGLGVLLLESVLMAGSEAWC